MIEKSHFIQDNKLFPVKFPFTEIEPNGEISDNFILQEYLNAMRFISEEEKQYYYDFGIPLNENLIQVAQIVRDFTGKPVNIGSLFRSLKWEFSKKRSGTGDHPRGNGIDLNGEDVYNVLHHAFETKNELYQKLKALGVNAYGFYSWGVHLGIRTPKSSGKDYIWYNKEKKNESDKLIFIIYFAVVWLFHKPIFRTLKKLFK